MARTPRTIKPFAQVARLTLAAGAPLSRVLVSSAIERHERTAVPRMSLLWSYYRNPMESQHGAPGQQGRTYRLAQERGLPSRVVGGWDRRAPSTRIAGDERAWQRKEVVVENDIAWRIQTMVDFMFGRPLKIASTASDAPTRATIERVLEHVWESSGGIALLQDMGLMGHVYGHVDLLVRATPGMSESASESRGFRPSQGSTPRGHTSPLGEGGNGVLDSMLDRAAATVRIELVEPPRGVALPGESDYREIDAYIIRARRESRDSASAERAGMLGNVLSRWWLGTPALRAGSPDVITTTEVFAGASRQLYQTTPDGETTLIDEGPSLVSDSPGDAPPVVHIQNISQPFEYEGLGEVEPLIPLQDELNTRLSDRAARVTMQSFKMYLAKGLDGAASMPIGPGMIWTTDNADAQVSAFGGDAASPSEDQHIAEVREAMDKVSSVPPVAGGVVQAKIGNLSSENALRITLIGLTSKTARKRITYGRGIVRASQLVLEALHRAGVLETSEQDRGLRIDWVDPIPRDEQQSLIAAEKKLALGVPRERVLGELGYATQTTQTAID